MCACLIQALDVALKHSVSFRNEVKTFARAIYWRDPTTASSLGGGAEVWRVLLLPLIISQLRRIRMLQKSQDIIFRSICVFSYTEHHVALVVQAWVQSEP